MNQFRSEWNRIEITLSPDNMYDMLEVIANRGALP